MHTTTKYFMLRYFCPPGDFKVKVKYHSDSTPADLKLPFKGQGHGQKCKKMA